MKRFLLLPCGAFLLVIFGFILHPENGSKDLLGTWEFVEMLDSTGKHIDTIWENNTFMIATGPKMTFRKDDTYSFQFTSSSTDNGTWTYDKNKNEILLKLYWKEPYDEVAKYIIASGAINKDEKGKYFDLISKKIIALTKKDLIILDKANRQMIYRKSN